MAMPLRHGAQLRVARGLFLSLLCVPVVILVLNTLFPGALNTNAAWQAGLAEVTAGLETQLSQPMTAPGIQLPPGTGRVNAIQARTVPHTAISRMLGADINKQ